MEQRMSPHETRVDEVHSLADAQQTALPGQPAREEWREEQVNPGSNVSVCFSER
jgi:hypothetical protein